MGRRAGADAPAWPALPWRLIGPHRGGRATAVVGHPTDRLTFFFGAAAGGVWATHNGGVSWRNLTDGALRRPSVGALALAPADPATMYVGLGEACVRNDVVPGDGVWRSDDAGAHWVPLGLDDTQHIGRILVHPTDPHTLYVAALGHAFGPNAARGVFRSRDGGRHWEHVLHLGPDAGAVDLAMDPVDPRTLYAALWEVRRWPWTFVSGGPGSGLHRSQDGGDHWVDITAAPGLPGGVWGRVGLATTPARAGRLWAVVEARDGGIFLSDDQGAHWGRTNEELALRRRPWYYNHIVADPVDPDAVYVLDLECRRSRDGGRTFAVVPTPHGDHHALWIDPQDPQRLINGHDGGAAVSFDGGASWSSTFNQPTAQFYHVTTDRRVPYRVYGAQQDNTTLSVPSQSGWGVVSAAEWADVGGGESGSIAVRPDNPNIVYAGSYNTLTRHDQATGELRSIHPWPELTAGRPAAAVRHRFPWTFPVVLSPHDPQTLYTAAEVVFRTRDEGHRWTCISPDLTRQDTSKMGPSGGPITGQAMNAEYYGTVSALAESPCRSGLLWAGTDDGRVHVSPDGGATWQDRTPEGLPPDSCVSVVEPSARDADAAYVAAHRYKVDDPAPYMFRTADGGRHWTLMVAGLPPDEWVRVVRQDPEAPALLYCGTETGVYISLDGGDSWQRANANLPAVPIYDLVVHERDLVAATHGRSFWVVDDVAPWRARAAGTVGAAPILYRPADALRWVPRAAGGGRSGGAASGYRVLPTQSVRWERSPSGEPDWVAGGANPAGGLFLGYELAEPAAALELYIEDDAGMPVRTVARGPHGAGFHRVAWDLRAEATAGLPSMTRRTAGIPGLPVLPGVYRAVLTVDGLSRVQSFAVKLPPGDRVDPAALLAQRRLYEAIRGTFRHVIDLVVATRAWLPPYAAAADTTGGQTDRGTDEDAEVATRREKLAAILVRLAGEETPGADALRVHPAPLSVQLSALAAVVALGNQAPTAPAREVFRLQRRRFADERQAAIGHVRAIQAIVNHQRSRQGRPPLPLPTWFEA